jgi:hypothetical protein
MFILQDVVAVIFVLGVMILIHEMGLRQSSEQKPIGAYRIDIATSNSGFDKHCRQLGTGSVGSCASPGRGQFQQCASQRS